MSEVTDKVDALRAKVEAEETVEDSLLAAFSGLAQTVRDQAAAIDANNAANSTAVTNLNALADKIDADSSKMADAVVANTPQA